MQAPTYHVAVWVMEKDLRQQGANMSGHLQQSVDVAAQMIRQRCNQASYKAAPRG